MLTIITDGKRGRQIDHPKTKFTLDSDKQTNKSKKTLRKTQKTKTIITIIYNHSSNIFPK